MRLTPISWGSSSLAFEGRRLAGSSSLADCPLSAAESCACVQQGRGRLAGLLPGAAGEVSSLLLKGLPSVRCCL